MSTMAHSSGHSQDVLYKALVSRDARFDGRFFVGVTSTGVYCRSICPASKPKQKNCEFFRTAAEAEVHGFRPCKRCRPEAAPSSPAWSGTSATVRRALRLIAGGALDEGSVETLSDTLGVTARHLRRLFEKHLGAAPLVMASTKRLHLARQLLEQTQMSVLEVAISAGFGSLRRFNAAFKTAYGIPPSALRERHEHRRKDRPDTIDLSPITISLAYAPPYNWQAMLAFLRTRAVEGLEHCDGSRYQRTFDAHGHPGVVTIEANEGRNALIAHIHTAKVASILPIVERIRAMMDVDADMGAIEPTLHAEGAWPVDMAGVRVAGAWDPFELTVRAILGQQVTVAAARTLTGRLCRRYGKPIETQQEESLLTHLFPAADALAEADIGAIGVPGKRAETIRVLARSVVEGDIQLDAHTDLEDAEERLLRLPGIGRWTVGYVRMRAFKDPDAFPAGDVALVKAARTLGIASSAKELQAAAERWRPWRAYAAVRLWRTLAYRPGETP